MSYYHSNLPTLHRCLQLVLKSNLFLLFSWTDILCQIYFLFNLLNRRIHLDQTQVMLSFKKLYYNNHLLNETVVLML